MSQVVDKRVVEMSFDNSNFEKNVSTSMSTLDKLKKALKLDGVSKGLDQVNKSAQAIDLSRVASGVDALQRRFSVLGEVSNNALVKMTNNVAKLSTSLFRFVADGIKSGGIKRAMNLEQANFMLQGLLKDNEAVAAVMADVSKSVDGTAYSLDAAAKVAAQFAATGMRGGEQMYSALRGVAGVAAMTNSNYEQIGMIFSQVAGKGRVMGDELLQLASRGINAAATLKEYMNKTGITANATEGEIREMVSKGKIDFALFAAAMDDAFGEHATKANETFQGSMANIRSALARIGADFVAPLVKQNGALVTLFNSLRVKVNEVRKQTTPFAEETTKALISIVEKVNDLVASFKVPDLTDGFQVLKNLAISIRNIFVNLGTVIDPIKLAFKDVFPEGLPNLILMLSEALVKLTGSAKLNLDQMVGLRGIFTVIFGLLKWGGTIISKVVNVAFEHFGTILSTITGYFSKFGSYIWKNISAFIQWADSMNFLTNGIARIKSVLSGAINAVKNWFNAFKDLPQVQFTIESISRLLGDLLGRSRGIFKKMGQIISDFVKDALKNLKSFKLSSIGNLFKDLFNVIKEAFGPVISGWFENFKKTFGSLRDFLEDAGGDVGNVFVKIYDVVKGVVSKVTEVLGSVPLGSYLTMGFGAAVLYLANKLINTFFPLAKQLRDIFSMLYNPLAAMSGLFTQAQNVLIGFQKIEKAYARKINAEGLFIIAKAVATLAGSLIALSFVPADKLEYSAKALGILAASVAGLGLAFALINKIGGSGADGVGVQLAALAASLKIMVSALADAGELSPLEAIKGLLVSLGVLAEIVAATVALSKFTSDSELWSTTAAVVGISVAMKIMVSAFNDLQKADPEGAKQAVISLVEIMGMLAILVKIGGNSSWQSALAFVGAVLAIRTMVNTIKAINKISQGDIVRGIAVIGAFEMLLGSLSLINGLADRIGGEWMHDAGGTFLKFAGAIGSMVLIIKLLNRMSIEEILKGISVIGMFELLFIGVSAISRIAGEHGKDAALTMIAFSGSILILVAAIGLLSTIPNDRLMGATVSISIIGAIMAAIVGLSHFARPAARTIKSITIALGVLSGALLILSFVEPTKLMNASLALSLLLSSFALVVASTGLAKRAEGTLLIMSGVVAILAAVLISLNGLNPQSTIPNAVALSTLLLAFSAAFLIASNAKEMSMQAMLGMAAMSGVMIVLAGVLYDLAKLNVETNMTNVIGLGLLLAELSLIVMLFDKGNLGPDAIYNAVNGALAISAFITIFGAVIGAIGALFELVNGMEEALDTGLRILTKLGTGLGEFIGGFVGGVVGSFITTVGNSLIIFGIQMSAFMVSLQPFFAYLKQVPDNALDKIGQITGIVLALTGAQLLEGLSNLAPFKSSMADLGQTLSEFIGVVKDISTQLKDLKIDSTKVETVKNCAELLNELQHAMVGTGGAVQAIMGEKLDLGVFGNRVKAFITAMVDVSKSLEGVEIQESKIKTMANLGELYVNLQAALPKEGGGIQAFLGTNINLAQFGLRVKAFITAMKTASESLDGVTINETAITACANMGDLFAELQNTLPEVGGVVEEFMGHEMNLTDFGSTIKQFCNSMVIVSDLLTAHPINEDAITSATNMGLLLQGLQDALPPVDGYLQDWFGGGEMTLSEFGQHIRQFAMDMQYVSVYAKNVSSGAVYNFVSAAEHVKKLFDILPKNKGGIGTGHISMSDFGTTLVNFGGHMKQFNSDISGFNFINLTTMAGSLQALVDVFKNVENLDSGTVESFTSSLEELAKDGVKSFTDTFDNAGPEVQTAVSNFITTFVNSIQFDPTALSLVFEPLIDNALLTLTSASEYFMQAAIQIMTAFSTGIATGVIVASTAGMTLCQAILHTFDSHAEALGPNSGMSLVKAIADGITREKKTAIQAIEQVLRTLLDKIRNKQSEFINSGKSIITSISQGITSMTALIKIVLDSLLFKLILAIQNKEPQFKNSGSNLITQMAAGMISNSDSALVALNNVLAVMYTAFIGGYARMYSSGAYLVQGLAQGVRDNAWIARQAAENLAYGLSLIVNNVLKVSSPSKVAYETGKYYDQGLAKGLTDNSKEVLSAGDQIAKALMKAIDVAIPPIEEGMKEFGSRIVTKIAEGMESNKDAFTKIIKDVVDKAVPNAIESLGHLGTDIMAKIRDSIAGSNELNEALEKQVTTLTEKFQESLIAFGKDIMGKITEGMQTAKDKIPNILGEILNEITPKLLKNIGEASTQLITEKIMEGLGTFEGFNDQMKESLIGFFPSVQESYIELGTKMMDKINEGMKNAKQVIPEVLTEIVNEMTPQILKNIGSQSTELITEKIIEGIGSFKGFNEDAKKYLTSFFPEVNDSFYEFGKQIMEKVNEGMREVNDVIPEVLDEIATKAIPEILGRIGEISTDVITKKILEGFGEFEGFDEKTAEKLSACFPDILDRYKVLGTNMIKQINVGFEETGNLLSDTLEQIVTKMTPELLKNLGLASTQLMTSKIIEGIKSFKGFTEAMKEQFTGFMPDIEDTLFEMGKQYIEKINEGIASSEASVGGRVVESIKESKNDILLEIENLTGEIVDTLGKAMSSFGEFGSILVEKLIKSSDEVAVAMKDFGGKMVSWIINGIDIMYPEFLSSFLILMKRIKEPVLEDARDLGFKIAASLNESMAYNSVKTRDILVKSITNALLGLVGTFKELGIEFMSGLMKSPAEMLEESLIEIVEKLSDDYFIYGEDIIKSLANGIKSANMMPKREAEYAVSRCAGAIRRYYSNFSQAGAYLMAGLEAGIRSRIASVVAAAIAAAEAANAAVNSALQINSPSRVGMKSGQFYVMGIAKGILEGTHYMVDAAKSFAKTVKETLDAEITDVINSLGESDEFSPTITPVLDLTKVRSEASQIDAMFTRNRAMSISDSIELARLRKESENQNGKEQPEQPQYNFVQNNYSPKALSRLEIYRDTKSLVRSASRKKVSTT